MPEALKRAPTTRCSAGPGSDLIETPGARTPWPQLEGPRACGSVDNITPHVWNYQFERIAGLTLEPMSACARPLTLAVDRGTRWSA